MALMVPAHLERLMRDFLVGDQYEHQVVPNLVIVSFHAMGAQGSHETSADLERCDCCQATGYYRLGTGSSYPGSFVCFTTRVAVTASADENHDPL